MHHVTLLAIALVAANPLSAGEPFVVDKQPSYVPSLGDQFGAAAGTDGSSFFVVWEDARSGVDWDLYANRVLATGQVLGPAGICLIADSLDQVDPAIAFDGTYYLVAWTDRGGGEGGDIRAARVTHGGEVIDTLTVSAAAGWQADATVAFDGTNYLVAWSDSRGGSVDIYAARVSQTGTLLDTAGIVVSAATGMQARPAAVFDGTRFVVAWEDCRQGQLETDIYAARVAASGVVLDTAGIAVSTGAGQQFSVAAATNDSLTVIAWCDRRNGLDDIYAARVDRDGTVLDSLGIPVSTAAREQYSPCVAFDGADFVVAWQDERTFVTEINGARLTPAGTVLDPDGFEICNWRGAQAAPTAAGLPGLCLVAWQDTRNVNADIYAARVRPDGSVPDPAGIMLSGSANQQRLPSVAGDSSRFLVVWQDARVDDYNHGIYGARVTAGGTVLDSASIAISATEMWENEPAVGWDGANYYVAWSAIDSMMQTMYLYGAQVLPDGRVANRSVICGHETNALSPAVAGGPRTLVAWVDGRGGADIYGARITRQGVVMDPDGFAITASLGFENSPAVALGPDSFLVVYCDSRSGNGDIRATRVTQSGVVLDPVGIVVSAAPETQMLPAVAFDGTNWLVAWQDRRDSTDRVYGARVTPAGAVLDTAGIPIAAGCSPCVAFDGTDFIVAWQDTSTDAGDIRAARVSGGGIVLDTATVVSQPGEQSDPALGGTGSPNLLLAWCGWTGDFRGLPYNTCRTWAKTPLSVGVAEDRSTRNSPHTLSAATIVRGVLDISRQLTADGSRQELLDALGRSVLSLRPGPNDVSSLAAGVYFIESTIDHRQSPIARVVITR